MTTHQFSLLTTRRFLPFFITQFLGAFNDNVFKNALVILINYRLAERAGMNSQIVVTEAAGLFILPFFLFSATAGQLADKFEKARLTSVLKVVEIFLMLIAMVGFYCESIPILMLDLFLLGTQATFFGPIKYSILPVLLPSRELIAGNGLTEAGTFLAILLGTILGGVLILQPSGDFIISIALFILSLMGFLSSLYIPNTQIKNHKLTISWNFIRESYRVMQYSKARRDMLLCIVGISWFWLVGAVFLAEFPVFAKDILHANQYVVTVFLTLFSVGIAIGSLFCNLLLKGRVQATYVPLAALGITIFTLDLYFAARHHTFISITELMGVREFFHTFMGVRISFDLFMLSICGGLYTVPLYAILQQRSDAAYRARVIASNNIMNALFMVIAAAGTLIMLKMHFTVNDVFLLIALLNVIFVIYIRQLLRV